MDRNIAILVTVTLLVLNVIFAVLTQSFWNGVAIGALVITLLNEINE